MEGLQHDKHTLLDVAAKLSMQQHNSFTCALAHVNKINMGLSQGAVHIKHYLHTQK
jgi:hypothetical protein